VLFAALISGGTSALDQQVKTLTGQLDKSWTDINGFKSGSHPNREWIQAVDERKTVLDKDYSSTHAKLYLEQEKLMTWPDQVAEVFKGRPFGADLSDEGRKYIFEYRTAVESFVPIARVLYSLYVLDKRDDGKIIGLVDVGPDPSAAMTSLIHFPQWTDDPTSMEAWLAQEMLWIQHAVIRSIREVNRPVEESFDVNAKDYDGTKPWLQAPIKRLYRIGIGQEGMSQPTLAKSKELKTYTPPGPQGQQQPSASTSSSEPKGLNAARYIETNEQYRLIPVSVHLLVDQDKITQVLGGLANTDFNFIIQETRVTYPTEKVELPALLRAAGLSLPGRGADNPLYNCVELDVFGTMRFYEMPAEIREKRKTAAKGTGTATEPSTPNETKTPEASKQPSPQSDPPAEGKKAAPEEPAKTPTVPNEDANKKSTPDTTKKDAGAPAGKAASNDPPKPKDNDKEKGKTN
jgi:hypothetical protein